MEKDVITRAYLESLSFADLQKVADDYSVDVPEDFNRSFLIAELLELSEQDNLTEDMQIAELDTFFDDSVNQLDIDVQEENNNNFLGSYNITEVEIILRNPAWAYIYWNISQSDRKSLENAFVSELKIRVNSFSQKNQIKPDEFFDIQISKLDCGQYFLLPAGKKFFRVDLLFNLDGIIDILASSNILEMPVGTSKLVDFKPGKDANLSPILELSSMNKLLLQHYKNHRESFI